MSSKPAPRLLRSEREATMIAVDGIEPSFAFGLSSCDQELPMLCLCS